MKTINSLVKVESKTDWDAHYDSNWGRFNGGIYLKKIDDTTVFPLYLKEVCSGDYYTCNTYVDATKDDWERQKVKEIESLLKRIERIKTL